MTGNKLYGQFKDRLFILFVLIGVVNTCSTALCSALYAQVMDANGAFVAGYATGLVIGYFLNAKINFHAAVTLGSFGRYALSYVPNFLLQNLIVFLIYNVLGWDKLIAYGGAAVLALPLTYLLVKLFAFRKNKSGEMVK